MLLNKEPVLDPNNTDVKRKNVQLKRILGIILSLVMIALAVYVLHLQNQNSTTLFKSTDLALTASSNGAFIVIKPGSAS